MHTSEPHYNPKALQKAHERVSRGTQTEDDMARIISMEHFGWVGCPGGYIKDQHGRTIAQGWDSITARLRRRGIVTRTPNGMPCIDWDRVAQTN